MEKTYACIGCARVFILTLDPMEPPPREHESEMNVECPFCSKTNAIVWPQDSLPLIVGSKEGN
jgi:DNA-directed RNA polymerase subunit RPC12/RpoP